MCQLVTKYTFGLTIKRDENHKNAFTMIQNQPKTDLNHDYRTKL
ncbi:hypothetical protein VIBNIAM115_1930010 [Vibrio nigripulchritudo AM115]|nr:hypothetical protein VIBNIAM115_1930010 [Vibrio nigripulchritudo AM115]